jgi:hypothetical protein
LKESCRGDLPATQDLSSKPSMRSMMSAEDVSATAKKKTILQRVIRRLDEIVVETYVRMTPGATKSVNEGLLEP